VKNQETKQNYSILDVCFGFILSGSLVIPKFQMVIFQSFHPCSQDAFSCVLVLLEDENGTLVACKLATSFFWVDIIALQF